MKMTRRRIRWRKVSSNGKEIYSIYDLLYVHTQKLFLNYNINILCSTLEWIAHSCNFY